MNLKKINLFIWCLRPQKSAMDRRGVHVRRVDPCSCVGDTEAQSLCNPRWRTWVPQGALYFSAPCAVRKWRFLLQVVCPRGCLLWASPLVDSPNSTRLTFFPTLIQNFRVPSTRECRWLRFLYFDNFTLIPSIDYFLGRRVLFAHRPLLKARWLPSDPHVLLLCYADTLKHLRLKLCTACKCSLPNGRIFCKGQQYFRLINTPSKCKKHCCLISPHRNTWQYSCDQGT